MMSHRSSYIAGAIVLASVSAPALAQQVSQAPSGAQSTGNSAEGSVSLQEVVVTAQKRSESVQDIPLAVTAISGAQLAKAGISNLEGLQAVVPNLNLGQQLGVARISLRGIGLDNLSAGAEGSIAFHVDGIFVSRSAAALSAFYDVDRVEVLRGPQGTLYGRNATGGSINVISREPTPDFSGYGDLTIGNYSRVSVAGAVSGPVAGDKVLGRLAFETNDRDGYGHNIVTGQQIDDAHALSFRGSLKLLPSDNLTALIVADYHHEKDHGNGYHYLGPAGESATGQSIVPFGLQFGGVTAPDRRDIASDTDPFNRRTLWGVMADVTYDFGALKAKSLTAYRSTKYETGSDLDSTSFRLAPIFQFERARQFSQEFQLTGTFNRLRPILGLYYFHENIDGGISVPYNDIAVGGRGALRQGYFAGGNLKTDAGALFGQLTYDLTDSLRLTLGGRYSIERKRIADELQFDLSRLYVPSNPVAPLAQCAAGTPSVPTCQPEHTWRAFTPRINIEYEPTRDLLLYATMSRGFKSGTYNLGGVQPPVAPEKVTAYEGGVKSETFDHRLRANFAAFYYDYKDLQVGKVVNASLVLENAATATIYGAELEVQALVTPSLELGLTGSYLNATFDKFVSVDPSRPGGDGVTIDPDSGLRAFNNAGNRLPQAPRWGFHHSPSCASTGIRRADRGPGGVRSLPSANQATLGCGDQHHDRRKSDYDGPGSSSRGDALSA